MIVVQNPTDTAMVAVPARRNVITQAPIGRYTIKPIDLVDYLSRKFLPHSGDRRDKLNLAVPVISQADLNAVELGILCS